MEGLPPLSEEAKNFKFGIYEHYKKLPYQALSIGRHSETLEEYVVYKQLYGTGDIWIRPLKMFIETITGPDGKQIPRFRFIEGVDVLKKLH